MEKVSNYECKQPVLCHFSISFGLVIGHCYFSTAVLAGDTSVISTLMLFKKTQLKN